MPIRIYKAITSENIAIICDNVWDLPTQIDSLEKWITLNADKLSNDKYIADIGFDIRPDASGGGAVLSSDSMKILAAKGFDIFFSEYPNQL